MTTARSRRLGTEVRALRKGAELRLEELADQCGWSRATLGRIEAGTKIPSETETAIILGTLGIRGDERQRLLDFARNANQSHWWEAGFSGLPSQLLALVDFERSATKITDVSLALVPGLLQTAAYARAIVAAGGVEGDELESRVALRLGRQGILTRNEPTEFHAVLDESVLHRAVGGREVMCEQLRHVARMARCSNVVIRVVPLDAGAHVGLNGSQLLLEFSQQRSIVHLEHRKSSLFLDDPAETSLFFESLPSLINAALSPAESVELIVARADALEDHDGTDWELAKVQPQR